MRVTQSMLSNNMLRNLNTSYGNMSKLQDQINSGSKISRPSDDPVVAIKGMGYRTELGKNEQYQRNLNEAHTWLDTTDEALDQTGTALIRVKELIVQAANDSNTTDDRQKIAVEIEQIRQQMQDVANTQAGGKYIFSGTNTQKPLFTTVSGVDADGKATDYHVLNKEIVDENGAVIGPVDGAGDVLALPDPLKTANGVVSMEVFSSVQLQMSTPAADTFAKIDSFLAQVSDLLKNDTTNPEIAEALGADLTAGSAKIPALDTLHADVLMLRADVGAKQNRAELMGNRLEIQNVNIQKQMSENEDVDYAKAITDMTAAEAIHQAALSVGAKIIQQTLVDFMR